MTGYDHIANYVEHPIHSHDNRGRPSPHILKVKSSSSLLGGDRMRVMNAESGGLCGPSSIHMFIKGFILFESAAILRQGAREINEQLVGAAAKLKSYHLTTLKNKELEQLLDPNKSYHWSEAHFAFAATAFDINIHLWKLIGDHSLPV